MLAPWGGANKAHSVISLFVLQYSRIHVNSIPIGYFPGLVFSCV